VLTTFRSLSTPSIKVGYYNNKYEIEAAAAQSEPIAV
jgi:hypothetical protein